MNKFTVLIIASILITSSISFAQYYVPPITGYALANCRDLNADGKVTIDDLLLVANIIGSQRGEPLYNSQYDLDNDGRIDSDDISIVKNQLGGSCSTNSVYDVNSDGLVNVDDIIAIADRVGVVVGNSQFDPRYDVTNDGRIDSDDVNAAAMQYSAAYTPTSQIGIGSLLDVVAKLDSLKQGSQNSKATADSLVIFYQSQGDSAKANKWSEISSLLDQSINKIDEIKSLINNNINNIDPVKSLIRQKLAELRVLTRDINNRLSEREAVNLVVASCADVNGDGGVSVNDILEISQRNGAEASKYPASGYDPKYDLNNDGKIDTADVSVAQGQYGKQCIMDPVPSISVNQCFDVDGDSTVTISDINGITQKAGTIEGHPSYNSAYDIDHDKNIGSDDALLANSQYFKSCSQIGVTTIPATTTIIEIPEGISSLCADVDGDGRIEVNDILAVSQRSGTTAGSANYDPKYDLNNDGKIDTGDVSVAQGLYGVQCTMSPVPTITRTCFDVTGDGIIGIEDTSAVTQKVGAKAGDANYNPSYDIDNDNNIGSDDVQLVVSQYFKTCSQPGATTTTITITTTVPATTTTMTSAGTASVCADVDGNGIITINDISAVVQKSGAEASKYPTSGYIPKYDLNNDGKIDSADASVAQGQYNSICTMSPVPTITRTCFDVTGDGFIGLDDISAVTQKAGTKAGDANYDSSYDIDNDNNIGSDDVQLVVSQYFKTC